MCQLSGPVGATNAARLDGDEMRQTGFTNWLGVDA
jgi:hypothetical protein